MKNAGVHYVKISSAQRGLAGYTYTVSLFDDTAELLDTSVKAVLTVPSALGDLSHMSLYYMDGEERVSVRYSDNDTEISFTARVNKQYYSSLQYSVSVIPSELVSISVSELSVSPGRKIKISVDVPIGVTLKSLYYLDESGARVSIEPGYLVMPMYDLRIGCDAAYREFTVKFVSDGKVISSRVYKYGAEVEVPDDPKKASDDSYDYEFSGWSSEIVTVTEDVTYVAEYSKTPIEIKNDDGGLKITPSVMRLLLIGGVGISIACLGFLPSFLLALVLFIRHKSLKKTRKD